MKFTDLFPLQVVINLDKRPDKLEHCMKKEFPKIKIKPLRKPGNIFTMAPTAWWNGAVGCLLSHYEALEGGACLDTNIFIFEDDVSFLGSNAYYELTNACEEISKLEWDMFYIGGNLLKPCYEVSPHLAKLTHAQSTYAYGVNKKFIRTLLKYIDLAHIDRPIDVIYADTVIPKHNCYISIPILSVQKDSYSDIEGRDVNYTEYLEKRYWANLKRKD